MSIEEIRKFVYLISKNNNSYLIKLIEYKPSNNYKTMKKIMNNVTIKKVTPVFEDERGEIFDLLDDENILHIGIITSKAGTIRGNHYHKIAKQFNYILKGKAEFIIRDSADPNNKAQSFILTEGDFISIPPKIIHSVRALDDLEFIDLNTTSRSGNGYEEDTIRM